MNGVVLAENSGDDLTPMRELVGDRDDVELLSIAGSEAASGAGRGWLETQLVAEAVATSELVRASSDLPVWKTTGRYQVRNPPRLVATARPGGDLYLNLRRHPEQWADMWVYGVTPAACRCSRAGAPAARRRQPRRAEDVRRLQRAGGERRAGEHPVRGRAPDQRGARARRPVVRGAVAAGEVRGAQRGPARLAPSVWI